MNTLDRLIRSKGISRYGIFASVGEGSFFPDGTEDSSGYVIDERGRVFSYWTAWDHERGCLAFDEWKRVRDPHDQDPEYLAARKAAGLA